MTQLARGLGASLVLILMAGLVALVALALYARSLRRHGYRPDVVLRRVSGVALVLVVFAIAAVTLVPTGYAGQERALNLVPGHGLSWPWQSSIAAWNILGNVGMFFPLAFLLPLLFARLEHLGRFLLLAIVASVAIEVLQYTLNLGRAADINDVICNVLGAACGWTAMRLVRLRDRRTRELTLVRSS